MHWNSTAPLYNVRASVPTIAPTTVAKYPVAPSCIARQLPPPSPLRPPSQEDVPACLGVHQRPLPQGGAFGTGLLWGQPYYLYANPDPEVAARAAQWATLAARHNVSLPAAAVAFAYMPACVERVAVGCAAPEHVESNVRLCDERVPVELWKEAQAQGLLPGCLVIPHAGPSGRTGHC